jgi:TPR repeat protein
MPVPHLDLPRPRLLAWTVGLGLCLILGASAVQAGGPARDLSKFVPGYRGVAAKGPPVSSAKAAHYRSAEPAVDPVLSVIQGYCEAARKGDPDAQFHLGWIYANGNGVARDEQLAAAWFQQAAKGGDVQSGRMLKALGFARGVKRPATCVLPGRQALRQALRPQSAKGPIASMVRNLAPEYRLDPELVLAVVEVESNFNARALSPKNAQGLMQLIPATAERFGVEDVWDAEDNLRGGMAYLQWLLERFDGDVKLALAAYNAGENAVDRHNGVPPYSETRAYVTRISEKLDL